MRAEEHAQHPPRSHFRRAPRGRPCLRRRHDHDRERQRPRRRLQRPDASGAGRRQPGHDARPAAAHRVPVRPRTSGARRSTATWRSRSSPPSSRSPAPPPSAVLGSAGTRFIWSDFPGVPPFPGAEFPATWYHQALANKRAGFQINTDADHADIRARFNVNLGLPGCLTGIGWYLRLRQQPRHAHRPRHGARARVRARPRLRAVRERDVRGPRSSA